MRRRVLVCLGSAMLWTVAAAAQMPEDYLDVLMVKVKPEKRADFDANAKKVAEANRNNSGDTWIAMETAYGEGNTVSFISTRQNYAAMDKAAETFMGAMNKAFGKEGAEKMFQDFGNTMLSSRSETRRRRWDLSANVPSDPAALLKIVGESRFVRTVLVHVRPGQTDSFESLLKDIKAAQEKANSGVPLLVSQVHSGGELTGYYISRLLKSLGDLDSAPPMQQLLGQEGYQKFLKTNAEAVVSAEAYINRFLPELSNPPKEVAAAAPDFWNPKS